MEKRFLVPGVFVAVLALPGLVYGAENAAGTSRSNATNADYVKLSRDGALAFNDIGAARVAIFNGRPSEAEKLIKQAQDELHSAGSEDATFNKAEADLKPPSSIAQPAHDNTPESKQAIAWIPIDGEYAIDETFAPTQQKMQAIGQANKDAHRGNVGKADALLKVTNISADYTLTLAPLKKTDAAVDRASELMNAHDYYGASQALRTAENDVRYDIAEVAGPKSTKTAQAKQIAAASPAAASSN